MTERVKVARALAFGFGGMGVLAFLATVNPFLPLLTLLGGLFSVCAYTILDSR